MAARRQRGEGSFFYDDKAALWVGELDLGYVGGRRRRKRVTSTSQQRALAKFNAAKKQRDAGNLTTANMRLDKWLGKWLDDIAGPRLKPKTKSTYRSYIDNYLVPAVGHKRLDKLETDDVRALHKHMRSLRQTRGKRKGQPLSETTIRNAHRILCDALNDAMSENKLGRNVAAIVSAPTRAPGKPKGLNAVQARQVLAVDPDDRYSSRWLAAFLLGARQGEILGLRWTHLDLDTGRADISWSLQRIGYRHGCRTDCGRRPSSCPSRELDVPPAFEYEQLHGGLCLIRPKSDQSQRIIPLAPPLLAALRLWQKQSEHLPNPHGLVWPDANGRPTDGRDDYARWTARLQAAGVPHVTLHEARHTAASLLLDAKVPPEVIKQILGHSEVLTTMIYAQVSTDLAMEALTGLGEALALP